MEQHHFDIILEQLTMIENNTRKKSIPVEPSVDKNNLLDKLQEIFFNGLTAKTGWGRIEIKKLFENARSVASKDMSTISSSKEEYPF